MKAGLVIYAALETMSGGYLYDRRLVETLRSAGDTVEIISMPWQNYAHHLGHNFQARWARSLIDLDADVLLQDELNHPSLFRVNLAIRELVTFPILAIVHHLRSSEEHPQPLRWLYRLVERSYLQTVDGFIWNSETTRQVVQGVAGFSRPGVVAYPGGDRFEGLPEAEITRRSRRPGARQLLFVGNLIPRKGLHRLIPALGTLKQAAWTLKVVGDPSVDPGYAKKVLRQVEETGLVDRIQFLGRLSEDELEQEWRCSDILVLPSSYEGFGIVTLEGMSFGLPAITSRSGAAHELVEDGVNGFLVDPANPDALAKTIWIYLSQPETLLKHSLAARWRFESFPTWDQTTHKIRQFLLEFQKDSHR